MGRQLFFSEHVTFLKEKIVWGQSYKDLMAFFNDKFETAFTVTQIKSVCAYRNLILGRPPVDVYHPVGSERIAGNGYVMVKIAHPEDWKYKHHLVWESAHGPLPAGYVIIFGDRNKYNFALDNLILASKQELSVMNRRRLIQAHADLTRSGLLIARLRLAITKRKAH